MSTMLPALLIAPDQQPVEVAPKNGTDFTLEELYTLLGCDLIQVIEINEKLIMIMDEEGKLKPGELNHAATLMVNNILMPGDNIIGPVIVCPSSMLE